MDGGMRSATNADLAKGYERVVVVAVTPGAGAHGPLATEIAGLRAGGSTVVLITPDAAARKAIFPNPQEPERREPSAQAGLAQAANEAQRVRTALG
jgi:NTE family protein